MSEIPQAAYNFYPRPPRGGRPCHPGSHGKDGGYFYPRPPRGGRPVRPNDGYVTTDISIHALREEGDRSPPICASLTSDFYPRPPRGGRPLTVLRSPGQSNFYPRPPRGGRRRNPAPQPRAAHFYPRPPRGGRQLTLPNKEPRWMISIHALRVEGDAVAAAAKTIIIPFLSTPSARRATPGA